MSINDYIYDYDTNALNNLLGSFQNLKKREV